MAAVTSVLKALSNPNRMRVYQVICRRTGARRDGLTIERICKHTGMKQPAVSHHVANLTQAGLIVRTKSKWWVHCAPDPEGLALLRRFARNPAAFPLDGR
jgi:DNA-binding transcriptional ArsR family regulator